MLPNEVFLSHSDLDHDFATQIVETLRNHGIPVWFSADCIKGAQEWHDEIGAALNRCDWFLIILSPNAVDSMWVKRELLFALQQRRLVDKIIPLLLKPCNYAHFSWTLSQLQIIDFTSSFEDGCRELLRIWGIGYKSHQIS